MQFGVTIQSDQLGHDPEDVRQFARAWRRPATTT